MNAPAANQKSSTIRRWLIVLGIFVVLCAFTYPFIKRTFLGIEIRSIIKHVPPAQLLADDLADDVRTKKQLAPLQEWSVETLARYRAGRLTTTGRGVFSGWFSAKLAPGEVPSWLEEVRWQDHPEVSVVLNYTNDEPEFIHVAWNLCGLWVGPTNYVATFHPWYIVEVKPGIYAYSVER